MRLKLAGLLTLFGVLLFVATLSVQTQSVVQAQEVALEGPTAVTSPADPQLGLTIDFALLDEQGNPILLDSLESGNVSVLGEGYPATLQNRPFYVALVIDTSGSVSSQIEEMLQQAVTLVQSAPETAHFAVIQFADSLELAQPFTTDKQAVINALQQINTVNRSTCLFDATYRAIQAADQGSELGANRAVLVFSDGRDELTVSAGSAPCSERTEEEVIDLASARSVPVHTIGFVGQGGLATDTLQNIAETSNGQFVLATQANAGKQTGDILQAMQGLYRAQTAVYTPQGQQTGLLNIQNGADTILVPFNFLSPRDYLLPPPTPTPTPIPNAIELNEFLVDDPYQLSLNVLRPTEVATLKMCLTAINSEAPSVCQEMAHVVNNVNLPTAFSFRADEILQETGTYMLTVDALDQNDGLLHTIDVASIDFDNRPILEIRSVDIPEGNIWGERELTLHIDQQNVESITNYLVELNVQGSAPRSWSFRQVEVESDSSVGSGRIVLPVSDMPNGRYAFQLAGFNEEGERLAQSRYPFTYQAQFGPIPAWIWTALLGLAICLFILGVIIGLLFALLRRRPQPVEEVVIEEQQIAVHVKELGQELGSFTIVPAGSPSINITQKRVATPIIIERTEQTNGSAPYGFTLSDVNGETKLIINNSQISRRGHARLVLEEQDLYVLDLRSRNGTYVGDRSIGQEAVTLPLDEELRLGAEIELTFQDLRPVSQNGSESVE